MYNLLSATRDGAYTGNHDRALPLRVIHGRRTLTSPTVAMIMYPRRLPTTEIASAPCTAPANHAENTSAPALSSAGEAAAAKERNESNVQGIRVRSRPDLDCSLLLPGALRAGPQRGSHFRHKAHRSSGELARRRAVSSSFTPQRPESTRPGEWEADDCI